MPRRSTHLGKHASALLKSLDVPVKKNNDFYYRLTVSLRAIARRHLNVGLTGRQQSKKAWAKFNREVLEKHPAFHINNPRSVGLARTYINRWFSGVRYFRRKGKRSDAERESVGMAEEEEEGSDEENAPIQVPTHSHSHSPVPDSWSSSLTTTRSSTSTSSPSISSKSTAPSTPTPASKGPPKSNSKSITKPTSQSSASTSTKKSRPLPPPPHVYLRRNQPSVQNTDRIAILQFLSRPAPSLTHLLPLFLSLGINNQARLDAMAGWPGMEVEKFISGLVNGKKLDAFEGKVIEMMLSGLLTEQPV